MQPPFGAAVHCPVLIGRSRDVAALQRLVDVARNGHGQCALISGEAGVGKSRLATEIAAHAVTSGFLVLRGHCFEQDESSPYAPLLDVLRSQFMRHALPARGAEWDPAIRDLVQLLPGIVPLPLDLTATVADDPDTRKHRLFAALLQHFADCAARQPLLLLFEDLHWSDDGSLELLQHLARFSADKPILLLLTFRSDDAGPRLRRWLTQVDHERLAQEFVLQRLTHDDVATMLRAIFGLNQPVRLEFLDAIYELTEGNPFFIEEALKALIAEGDIFYGARGWDRKPLDQLRIPRSVRDAVRQRVERLSEPARQVVALAAIAGRHFDFALLQELAQLAERALVDAIKELSAAQLIVEETADRFAFRHALTRQAIYADLLARERRSLHHATARILERGHGDALERTLGDLAYHYAEAQVWDKALEYARRAGEQARLLYAPQAAIQQFTRALVAATATGVAPPPELYSMRGAAYDMFGDLEAARADYETALRLARALNDTRAEWDALLALGSLYAGLDYAQTGSYFTQALDLARIVGDQGMIARSLNRVGNWHLNVAGPDAALGFHHEALGIFEATHERRGLAETLDLLGMTYNIHGDPRQSSESYARAIALFRELDDRQGLVNSLVIQLLQSGSYWHDTLVPAELSDAEALRASDEALQTAREIRWLAGECYVLYELALWLGPRGEYARALEMARSGLAIAEAIGHRQWTTGCHATLGALFLDLLDVPTARHHLELALGLAGEIGSQQWTEIVSALLASACVLQRDLPRAAAVLDAALQADSPMRTLGDRMVWCARAELKLAEGDGATALRIVEQLIAADPNASRATVTPRLWRLRGEALARLRRPADAESALVAGRDTALRRGARPLLWRLHLSLARLYQAEKRRADAERAFAAARSLIEALAGDIPEAPVRATFVREATRMLPVPRTPSSLQAARQASGGLTRREREVAHLLAEGKTNGEIAAALVVGKRTVETHISTILMKLGVTSRAQIVAWAIAHGLLRDAP